MVLTDNTQAGSRWFQWNDLRLERSGGGLDQCNRDRQREALWAGTPGIQEEDSIATFNDRAVGVAADDTGDSSGEWVEIEVVAVVNQVEGGIGQLDVFGRGQRRARARGVDVSTDRCYGCDGSQGFQDGEIADVACVENMFHARECDESLGTEKAVCVRNYPNADDADAHSRVSAMMQYVLPTLAFLTELVAFFVLARRGLTPFGGWQTVLRVVLALTLCGMAAVHFSKPAELARIVPPALPAGSQLVVATGVLELVAAIGLLWPRFAPAAATGFSFLLIAMFPANVYGAGQVVGGLRMPAVFPRTVMQMLFIALVLVAGWGLPRLRA